MPTVVAGVLIDEHAPSTAAPAIFAGAGGAFSQAERPTVERGVTGDGSGAAMQVVGEEVPGRAPAATAEAGAGGEVASKEAATEVVAGGGFI